MPGKCLPVNPNCSVRGVLPIRNPKHRATRSSAEAKFTGFDGCNSVEGQWSLNESGEIDLNVDEGSAVGCEELGEPDQVVLEDSTLIARNGETILWTLRKR